MDEQQKKRIFNVLLNYKFKYYILSYLSEKYFRIDRSLNVFMALATSGSVASWVIWEKFDVVWATIIVLAQIINVIRPYFPFSKYCREISEKQNLLQGVLVNFEILWTKIQLNKVPDDIAIQDFYQFKNEIQKILTFPYDFIFKVNKKMKKKADLKMKSYLKRNFDIELDLN